MNFHDLEKLKDGAFRFTGTRPRLGAKPAPQNLSQGEFFEAVFTTLGKPKKVQRAGPQSRCVSYRAEHTILFSYEERFGIFCAVGFRGATAKITDTNDLGELLILAKDYLSAPNQVAADALLAFIQAMHNAEMAGRNG